jgi:hypothetical protein
MLGQTRSGVLGCTKEELQEHLRETHEDPNRDEALPQYKELELPAEPSIKLNEEDITLKEVKEVVAKARSKSAPGESGTTYLIYKQCPKLLQRLWRLFKAI